MTKFSLKEKSRKELAEDLKIERDLSYEKNY